MEQKRHLSGCDQRILALYPGAVHGREARERDGFQDGETYIKPDEGVRATVVFDNLIHRREMPVTIGIFINPGMKEVRLDQRSNQYVPVNDVYARFLIEEILPEVSRNYNLVTDASGRAIVGQSDGGLCAFTVAWHRPDAFSKVISHIGSFTRLRGGADYPHLVRSTRGIRNPYACSCRMERMT